MPRNDNAHFDVLILGNHPATYLAAALLRGKSPLKVIHATLPAREEIDRLVLINPDVFDLHPLLTPLRRKLGLSNIYGLHFLSDDVSIRSEHRAKSVMSLAGKFSDVIAAARKLAEDSGAVMVQPKTLHVDRLDETGLDATIDEKPFRAKALFIGNEVPEAQGKILALPETWEREVVYKYCFAALSPQCEVDLGSRPIVPMSLDLKQSGAWGWLLRHDGQTQISISVPAGSTPSHDPAVLLLHWLAVLKKHGVLKQSENAPAPKDIHCIKLPLAGAMAQEGVADRTLLIGPAGGFYSACAEDIYPNCWSAIFAVEAIRKALKETHLQDALQLYRHKWRTTLGEYLRGPQQNLRFLLPMVYRNQVMTSRLAESILQGKSVVR